MQKNNLNKVLKEHKVSSYRPCVTWCELFKMKPLLITSKPGVRSVTVYLFIVSNVRLVFLISSSSIHLVFYDKTKYKNITEEIIYDHYLIGSGVGVCVRITVSSGGPIARLSLSRGPVRHLRKVLCSGRSGCCSLVSASCLWESCLGQGRGRWLGSGRTVRLLGPCCLDLQCRLAADPCTCERHYRKERSSLRHCSKVEALNIRWKVKFIIT